MHKETDKELLDRLLSKEAQAIDADPANDFPELTPEVLATGRLGFLADRFKRNPHTIVIDADLREAFPTEQAVNDALRSLLNLALKVSKAS